MMKNYKTIEDMKAFSILIILLFVIFMLISIGLKFQTVAINFVIFFVSVLIIMHEVLILKYLG